MNAPTDSSGSEPRLDVVLYLRGQSLDPQEISVLLGISGTRSRRLGDRWKTNSGAFASAQTGFWYLESGIKSVFLSEHLEAIWRQLDLVKPFHELPGIESAELNIYIELGQSPDGTHFESQLTPIDLEWISRSGVTLSVTANGTPD